MISFHLNEENKSIFVQKWPMPLVKTVLIFNFQYSLHNGFITGYENAILRPDLKFIANIFSPETICFLDPRILPSRQLHLRPPSTSHKTPFKIIFPQFSHIFWHRSTENFGHPYKIKLLAVFSGAHMPLAAYLLHTYLQFQVRDCHRN